jgi:hypothetical protein
MHAFLQSVKACGALQNWNVTYTIIIDLTNDCKKSKKQNT